MGTYLLLSNSTTQGHAFLEHAVDEIADVLGGRKSVVFVPFASRDVDTYTTRVRKVLRDICEVTGVQEVGRAGIQDAECVLVGGGNTFRLLAAMHRDDLLEPIARRVHGDAVYIGWSAGANVACPTIRTTNDMPIVENPSLAALGLVPFQINPHFIDTGDMPRHMGETREKRLAEFLEENDVPVLGMREGSWLRVEGYSARLGGANGARLFTRGSAPTDMAPGQDLSSLLRSTPVFDRREPEAKVTKRGGRAKTGASKGRRQRVGM